MYAAFAAGLAPVACRSEYAAVWLTYTPPVRFSDSATPDSIATARAASITFSSVEYTAAVSAPRAVTVRRISSEPVLRRVGDDEERDRAEALRAPRVDPVCRHPDQRRRPHPRLGNAGCVSARDGTTHRAQRPGTVHTRQHAVVDDRPEQLDRLSVRAEQLLHRRAEVGAELVHGLVALAVVDPVGGHEQVLRRRAHLPAVEHSEKARFASIPA